MVFNKTSQPGSKIIIFDWDDTICPSSYMDRYQIETIDEMPSHFQKLMADIAKCAARCLHEASKYGEVIIITNSDDGWVNYSCERFVPRLLPIIEKYRIVSARTGYEKFYPGNPLCWKAAAFAHEVNEHYESRSSSSDEDVNTSYGSIESEDLSDGESGGVDATHREVVSFGDSMEERTAVRIVAEQLSAVPKSVMFVQGPSPVQIIGQLQMLTQHMKFVCEHKSSLDLEINVEQAQRFAESYVRHTSFHSDQRFAKDLANMMIQSGTDSSPRRVPLEVRSGGSPDRG